MSRRIAENAELVWIQMREQGAPIKMRNGTVTVVEISMREVINDLFPQFQVRGDGGIRSAQDFHTEISIYLKYSGNAKLVKRPSPFGEKPTQSQWELSESWVCLEDEVVLDRARTEYSRRNSKSRSPLGRVMANSPGQDAPREDAVIPEPLIDLEPRVVLTEINGEPGPVAVDPFTAIQSILTSNAELQLRVASLTEQIEQMRQDKDRALLERNEARRQIRDLVSSWETDEA